jgi:hypothetical protein
LLAATYRPTTSSNSSAAAISALSGIAYAYTPMVASSGMAIGACKPLATVTPESIPPKRTV